jgi:transcriptional regulator GlxA family with amidase domain
MTKRRNVSILLFDDVEVLDFAGPFEVFTAADELLGYMAFCVGTVAESAGQIRAHNGLTVVADRSVATAPAPDVLVIPGGFGTRRLLDRPALLDWVKSVHATAEVVLSVCTGSLVLAKAGLLDGLTVTTHHEVLPLLEKLAPRSTVVRGERFLDHGKICTAAGVSAGIDASLHLVGRLMNPETATRTADYIEYERR